MKVLTLFVLIALAVAEEYYNTGDDDLDVDAFFEDEARAKQFIDCYMDREPCPKLAESYKKLIPEAVVQACKKCNPAQKHIFWKYLQGLKSIYAEDYLNFRKKYDPENKYFDLLEKEISKY